MTSEGRVCLVLADVKSSIHRESTDAATRILLTSTMLGLHVPPMMTMMSRYS